MERYENVYSVACRERGRDDWECQLTKQDIGEPKEIARVDVDGMKFSDDIEYNHNELFKDAIEVGGLGPFNFVAQVKPTTECRVNGFDQLVCAREWHD